MIMRLCVVWYIFTVCQYDNATVWSGIYLQFVSMIMRLCAWYIFTVRQYDNATVWSGIYLQFVSMIMRLCAWYIFTVRQYDNATVCLVYIYSSSV